MRFIALSAPASNQGLWAWEPKWYSTEAKEAEFENLTSKTTFQTKQRNTRRRTEFPWPRVLDNTNYDPMQCDAIMTVELTFKVSNSFFFQNVVSFLILFLNLRLLALLTYTL